MTGDAGHARHLALVYEHPDQFVDEVSGFVREGLHAGERVLVAAAREKLGWLGDALGEAAEAAELVDADTMYERHGPMLAGVVDFIKRHGMPGRGRVRVAAEQPLATRSSMLTRSYLRYEAAANIAYRPFAASVLCAYDASRLREQTVRDALRTHPELLTEHGPRRSQTFVDPRVFVREHAIAEKAPRDAHAFALDRLDDVPWIRHQAAASAAAAGLEPGKIADLLVAVGEVATNALVHGNAPRSVWTYVREGAFVCHIRDGGRGLTDSLVGHLAPDLYAPGGRGLWLAHQLCDVVETAHDTTGTHVSLRMLLQQRAASAGRSA
jgi:anti-sigma regulatory factor (Ser/Thr protein kinase)